MSEKKAETKPTPGKSSAAAPTSSSKKSTRSQDPEFLAHLMHQMKLTGVAERGHNFDCSHPYFWWTYRFNNTTYLRVDLLCWTTPPSHCLPKISPDGKLFYFSQKIPDRFLDVMRQFVYYGGEIPGNATTCDASIITENAAAINQIQDAFNLGPIKPLVTFKLPFPVQQEFEDPYREGKPGYSLVSLPHEGSKDGSDKFYVFSASMKEAKVARKKATVPVQDLKWDIPGAADADDDEEM